MKHFYNAMSPYLAYLLTDIRAAHRSEDYRPRPERQTLEEHFAEVEAWLAGEREDTHTFGWHCGLENGVFPPAERLTEAQMAEVVEAFDQLLFSWNITTDIPESVPIETAYRLLVSVLERKVSIVDSGFIGIEFCEYEPENCPFGLKWCVCKDF